MAVLRGGSSKNLRRRRRIIWLPYGIEPSGMRNGSEKLQKFIAGQTGLIQNRKHGAAGDVLPARNDDQPRFPGKVPPDESAMAALPPVRRLDETGFT